MSSAMVAIFVGLAAGTHTATWGMYKDAPHEGFGWRKYSRSIVVGALLAPLAAALFGLDPGAWGDAVVLFGLTYALERAAVEFYKTFLREEDQSKYTIPMQFHVFGRVVRSRTRRLLIGGSIVLVVGLLALVVWRWGHGRALAAGAVFLLGGVGGWISAFGGAWKDAPIEGFHWLKFWRSPALAGAWALVVSRFTDDIVVIAFAALGYTVATTETYKTFFFPSRPRGKFQGKPVLYPGLLRFRQRFVPLYAGIWLLIVLGLAAAWGSPGFRLDAVLTLPTVRADSLPPASLPSTPDEVAIDMVGGWVRRDWEDCGDPTRITFADGAITFDSRRSSALLWQVPSLAGPVEIDRKLDWVRRCDRAPLSFVKGQLAAAGAAAPLIDVSEYPYLSWRWRVEGSIDDSATARPDGKIRREGNDFAAKLGVVVKARDRDEAHEVAYVWARSLWMGTFLHQDFTVIPLVWKERAARFVVESGEGRGTWVEETRDLRADFARLVPGGEAGSVLRVYVMTDSDDTGGQVVGAYAGIRFWRTRPGRQVTDSGNGSAPHDGKGRR